MTHEKFERAKMLDERIKHITQVIDLLNSCEYMLDPPTRRTSMCIANIANIARGPLNVTLNEGECVFIQEALKNERDRLHKEFQNL